MATGLRPQQVPRGSLPSSPSSGANCKKQDLALACYAVLDFLHTWQARHPSRRKDPFWKWQRPQEANLGFSSLFPQPPCICLALHHPSPLFSCCQCLRAIFSLQTPTTTRLTPEWLYPSAQSLNFVGLDDVWDLLHVKPSPPPTAPTLGPGSKAPRVNPPQTCPFCSEQKPVSGWGQTQFLLPKGTVRLCTLPKHGKDCYWLFFPLLLTAYRAKGPVCFPVTYQKGLFAIAWEGKKPSAATGRQAQCSGT